MPANAPYPGESPEAFKRRMRSPGKRVPGGAPGSYERELYPQLGIKPMPRVSEEELRRMNVPAGLRFLLTPPQWLHAKAGDIGRAGYGFLRGAFQKLRGRK